MKDWLDRKGRIVDGILPFINPATGEKFGSIPVATHADVRTAVDEMSAASSVWGSLSIGDREQLLRQLFVLLLDEVDQITAILTQDTGKPRQDALIELYTCLNYFHTTLKKAPRWLKEERVGIGLQFIKHACIKHKPFGVVAVIAPWNYPLLLLMNPILGAWIAGNAVVAKPSEVTPAVAALMEKLIAQIPELRRNIRFLFGDGKVGADLVAAPPDMIFVTGSVQTGRLISESAARSQIPVVCELGGKDAMIVLQDADLDAAARWGVWGAFSNSGQTCIAPERLYVVKEVYEAFLSAVRVEVDKLRVGYSIDVDSAYHYGSMTYPRQLGTVQSHIDDAVQKGARVLAGGSHDGMLFQPTVLVDVDETMLIVQEETFGPVLPVMKVKDEAEAIARANDSSYGLSASVFSEDSARAQRVAESLQVGSVNINDTMSHYALPELPFGGVKQSGHGRSNGREGLLAFTTTAAYVHGKPVRWDIATKLREPGSYRRAKSMMLATLSPGWKRKLNALRDVFFPPRDE